MLKQDRLDIPKPSGKASPAPGMKHEQNVTEEQRGRVMGLKPERRMAPSQDSVISVMALDPASAAQTIEEIVLRNGGTITPRASVGKTRIFSIHLNSRTLPEFLASLEALGSVKKQQENLQGSDDISIILQLSPASP